MIAGLPDCVRRELGVWGFEFLKTHDVGLGLAKPGKHRLDRRRLMLLMLKLAIFISSGARERIDFSANVVR